MWALMLSKRMIEQTLFLFFMRTTRVGTDGELGGRLERRSGEGWDGNGRSYGPCEGRLVRPRDAENDAVLVGVLETFPDLRAFHKLGRRRGHHRHRDLGAAAAAKCLFQTRPGLDVQWNC